MQFIEKTFISIYSLLYRIHVYDLLAFLVSRENDKSIICREARKCTFYALKKMSAYKNNKGFEHEYGECAQH